MPLPKVHPLTKTYIELRRCSQRIEQFITCEADEQSNEYDAYLKLQELITEAMDMIPEEYNK